MGFISDLPPELVAAFRATLEEVLEADLILHVRDISHPETEEQAGDVGDILDSLGVDEDVALIEVWNKIDALSPETRAALRRTDARRADVQAVSALTGEGLPDLIAAIDARLAEVLDEPRVPGTVTLPHAEGRRRAWLHEAGVVEREEPTEDGLRLDVQWTERQRRAFDALDGGADRLEDGDEDPVPAGRALDGWDPLARDDKG